MINRKLMQKAFDLLCDAVEPTATQIQADIGMCAQWDVDAIECIDALRQALAQPEQAGALPPTTNAVYWMDMVVANLVRNGVNKHRAKELAHHFYTYTTPIGEQA
jgi:hypothetical protein